MSIFSRMFASNSVDPATNLAKTPAMDKTKSDSEWSQLLNPTQFKVLRKAATEPRLVTVAKGGWDDHYEKGTYVCQGCKTPLYTSEHKFDCGCGWPGFWTNIKVSKSIFFSALLYFTLPFKKNYIQKVVE